MPSYVQRFFDDFNDATPPVEGVWRVRPRAGSITEPAGSRLVLSYLAGADTRWTTGVGGAPAAVYPMNIGSWSLLTGYSQTFYVETLLNAFTGTGPHEGGLVFFSQLFDTLNDYGHLFYFRSTDGALVVRPVTNGTHGAPVAGVGSIGAPGTIYFRVYYNPFKSGGYDQYNIPEVLSDVDSYTLLPGWAAFYYKTSPGGSWARLYQVDLAALGGSFSPWFFGLYGGTSASPGFFTAGSWGFDYLSAYQVPSPAAGAPDSSEGGTLRIETTSAEETVKVDVPQPVSSSGSIGASVELRPTASAEEQARVIPPSFVGATPTNRTPLTQLHLRAAPSEVIAVAPEFPASAEESIGIVAGQTPTFHQGNSDSEGHPYFIGTRVYHQTYYDATLDVWHTPSPTFNGFGRDGYLYVNGVIQPTQAPWRTEAAGADRSARRDFPLRAMICTTQKEVVIFDLDSWPTSIKVWMRFRLGADSSNYYFIGRGDNTVRKATMKNGLLAVGLLNTSWEVGGIVLIDFKTQGQYAGNLIRSDNHWRLISGKTIANRNTTGLWETFSSGHRLSSNYVQWVDIFQLWAYWNDAVSYLAVGGEDGIEMIYYTSRTSTAQVDGVGAGGYRGTLSAGANNSLYTPAVVFDEDGWLWWSSGPRVYRSVMDHMWASNFIQGQSASLNYDARITPPYAELNHVFQNLPNPSVGVGDQVVCHALQPLGRYIFAGTNVGVFRIDRVTLEWIFCYSIVGYLGGGRLNTPPAGEIIAGDQPFVGRMHAFRTTESDYLVVSTVQGMTSAMPYHAAKGKGAVTIIRLYDDFPIQHVNPALAEDGAWAVNGVLY